MGASQAPSRNAPGGDSGNPAEIRDPSSRFQEVSSDRSLKSVEERKSSKSVEERKSINRSRFVLEHGSKSASLKDVYEVHEKVLGKGGFGTIRLARLRGHGKGDVWDRVVKTVEQRSAKDKVTFKREVGILKTLDHAYVCRIFETFEENKRFHLILEFIDGKDLFEFVFERLSNDIALEERMTGLMIWQIMQGLNYCHVSNIIHRDIKPENIMVTHAPECTETVIKLIDFGLAADMDALAKLPREAFCGTYAYIAPEITSGKSRAGAASDFWAVGLISHVLLLGDLPCDEVRLGEDAFELYNPRISSASQGFLLGLLQADPEKRMDSVRAEMANENSWTNTCSRDYVWSSCRTNLSADGQGLKRGNSNLSAKTVYSFVNFHRSVLLHKAVITAVSMQLLDSERTKEIQKQFVGMDADGNGKISKLEFTQAVAELAPEAVKADVDLWMSRVFDSIDTDHSGEIDYSEFLAAGIAEAGARSGASIMSAFRVFDTDGSGKISMEEFARVLDMMPAAIVRCIGQFDTDGDGEISFEEFKGIISGGELTSGPLRISVRSDSSGNMDENVTIKFYQNATTNRRQILV